MNSGAGQVLTQMEEAPRAPSLLASHTGIRIAESVLAAVLAALLYALTIQSRAAHIDEFYHLLAGQSWDRDGSFRILDGVYLRAQLFTMIVGATFDMTGRADLLTARIPSIVFSALSCGLLFYAMRTIANRWAAIAAAGLLALCGYSLDIAHFARFYALHAMLILVAAIALLNAMRPSERPRLLPLALSGIALVLAMHLQPVTAIAVLGLGLWLLVSHLHLAWRAPIWTLALGGLALLGFIIALQIPMTSEFLDRFSRAERWASANQDAPFYYIGEFLRQIPLLTLFFPMAGWIAWRRYGKAGSLGVIMVLVPLVLHSFAGMKAWRYCFYLYPFLCWTWGLAIGAVAEKLRDRGRLAPALASLGALAILMGSSPAYRQTVKIAAATRADRLAAPVPDGAWDRATPALRRLAAHGGTLITADDLRTLATVGRFDLFISHSRLGELQPPTDFTRDFRTGRPLIDTGDAMQAVIDCTPHGLLIISDAQWRAPMGVRPQVADVIEHNLRPDARAPKGFHVYSWRHHPPRQSCPYSKPPHAPDSVA